MLKRFRKIIALVLLLVLFIQEVPATYAIYSSKLSESARVARDHIRQSRQRYGTGTFENVKDKFFEGQKKLRETNQATGGTALFDKANSDVTKLTANNFLGGLTDTLSYIIGRWYGTTVLLNDCLRDDFVEIQNLQDAILTELFKSSLLFDLELTPLLWQDFRKMESAIIALRKGYKCDANNPQDFACGASATPVAGKNDPFFSEGEPNFYVSCPYGAFAEAFESLSNSFNNFMTAVKLDCPSCDWGSLGAIIKGTDPHSQERVKKKAYDWIKKNTIQFRLGGHPGDGGIPITFDDGGEGIDQLTGRFMTEFNIATSLLSVALPIFDFKKFRLSDDVTEFSEAYQAELDRRKQEKLNEVKCIAYDAAQDIWEPCLPEQEKAFNAGTCDVCINPQKIDYSFYSLVAYQKRVEDKKAELQELKKAVAYKLDYNDSGDSNLSTLVNTLIRIDAEIVASTQKKDDQNQALPALVERTKSVLNQQCVNKSGGG